MNGLGMAPVRARLGSARWHFQHGPIDLVLEAQGDTAAREAAFETCWHQFQHLLSVLVAELCELRRPLPAPGALRGPVAQRMMRACAPFANERFITAMAAVAGAVADELIQTFKCDGIRRAFINNGGDIALHLTPATQYRVGIWSNLDRLHAPIATRALDSHFMIDAQWPVRGIATSGWRGRSFSLGIADSVTVLADCAAAADAAATLIANAVDCEAAGIVRTPAEQLKDDTDLGSRLVTVAVPALSADSIAHALGKGRREAELWRDRGLIHAAALFLQGRSEFVLPATQRALAHETGGALERVVA
jgi:uncharacterized protein